MLKEHSNKTFNTHVDGVILARSSPIVLMTLLPQTHRPMVIPRPPKNRIQMGAGVTSLELHDGVVPINQMLTSGPMALL